MRLGFGGVRIVLPAVVRLYAILPVFLLVLPRLLFADHAGSAGSDALNFQTDLFTGRLGYQIPIEVAPARQGVQPGLGLVYSSSGGNGWCGYGWDLDMGFIERDTSKGTARKLSGATPLNQYDDAKGFRVSFQGVNAHLVNVGTNEYRAEVDNGTFLKFVYLNPNWEVTDKSGTKYCFGETSASRMENSSWGVNLGSCTFRWALSCIKDANGNRIDLTYVKDQSQLYLNRISYNANTQGLPATHTVDFILEARPDVEASNRSGFKATTAKRLKTIDVKVSNALVRRYNLAYVESVRNQRSILTGVTQFGSNGTSALPATTFSYTDTAWPVYPYSITRTTAAGSLPASQIQMAGDTNGDGLTDLIVYDSSTGIWTVSLSTGNGFQASTTWRTSFGGWATTIPFLGDFNGDGRTDFGRYDSGQWRFCLSNGTICVLDSLPMLQAYPTGTPITGDFNGDGLTDIGVYNANSQPNWQIALATGSGFTPTASFNASLSSSGARPLTGDFNGDGLTDIAIAINGTVTVSLSNGTGFEASTAWLSSMYGGYTGTDLVAADVNNDGLTDIVIYWKQWGDGYVHRSTGTGFAPNVFTLPSGFGLKSANDNLSIADFNGDGLVDLAVFGASGASQIATPQGGIVPNQIATISNGLGGKATVQYKPSTQYDNRGADGLSMLPFAVSTVSSVTREDGMGNQDTVSYTYKGGMFSAATKEFRGFNYAEVTDPLGAKAKTFFHQGGGIDGAPNGEYQDQNSKAKKGMPYRVEVWGSDGLKYSQTLNKVEEVQLHSAGWCFPFVSQTIEMEYEGLGNYRATATQFTYNTSNLNLTKESKLGEVSNVTPNNHAFSDIAADSVYTQIAYAALANTDIKNKPSSMKITSDSGGAARLRETTFSYDTRGNVVQQKEWIDNPAGYATTSFAYDAYGNVTSATDPAGIVTTTAYESAYRTFPATQSTGSFVTQTIYDAKSGQITKSIDVKGLVTQTTYDVFFRPTQVSISTTPNGAASLWREKFTYNMGGTGGGVSLNYVRHRVFDGVDTTNGHEAYTYSDGLGRRVQIRTEAETTGQYRVVDFFYDERGRPQVETLPILAGGSGFTTDAGQPGIQTEYDAIGRAFRTAAPVGDSGSPTGPSTVTYRDGTNPWGSQIVDPAGKVKKYSADAYGRIIQVTEVNGGVSSNTTYKYDLVGNLIQVKDSANITTTITYDSLGRKKSLTEPNMGAWSYVYDTASRLTEQKDAKNQKIKFLYSDPLGRMTAKDIYNSGGTKVGTVGYVYDVSDDPNYTVFKGQLYKMTDRQGWQKNGYDLRGRVLKTGRYLSTNSQTYVFDNAYDDADHLKQVTYPGNVAKLGYTYDTGGNLKKVESLSGTGTPTVFYTAQGFNAVGQLTSVAYGNGLTTTYTYFPNSKRLQQVRTTKSGGGYNQDLKYTYDQFSNLKSVTDSIYTGTASASLTTIQYDDLHRMKSVTSVAQGTKNYSYSPNGNILVNPEFGAGTYTYGVKPHAVTSANGKTYAYDVCGNMTTRGSQTLVYDEENQLKQVGSSITFGYDGGGARLWKKNGGSHTIEIGGIYEVKNGKVFCHVLAGDQRVATFEPITGTAALIEGTPVLAQLKKGLEFAGTWPFKEGRAPMTVALMPLLGILGILGWGRRMAPSGTSRIKFRQRGLFKQLISVLVIVAIFFGTTPQVHAGVPVYAPVFYYYHPDHLGSASILTDRDGDLVQHFEYTCFGKERFQANTQALPMSHRYTDQFLDEDTGLYYYNSRYYDPELGRFIQPDTIVPDPDNPQTLNRYTYVNNNPLKYIDPSGHGFFSKLFAIVAAVVVSFILPGIGEGLGATLIAAAFSGAVTAAAAAEGAAIDRAIEKRGNSDSSSVGSSILSNVGDAIVNTGQELVGVAQDFWGLAGPQFDGLGRLMVPGYENAINMQPAWAEGDWAAARQYGLRYVSDLAIFGLVLWASGGGAAIAGSAGNSAARSAATKAPVFWSGGRAAEDAARTFANATNRVTIGDTAAGRALANATGRLPWSQARPKWLSLSQDLARNAWGEVHVFQNARGLSLDSIWRTEYQILSRNPKITGIRYHVVMPDGSVVSLR